MKTLKALKITSIIQAIFCIFCLAITGCCFLGASLDLDTLFSITILTLYVIVNFSVYLPSVCFIINLVYFLKDHKDPEQRKLIGYKWIWIFVWLIAATACFVISVLPLRQSGPRNPPP